MGILIHQDIGSVFRTYRLHVHGVVKPADKGIIKVIDIVYPDRFMDQSKLIQTEHFKKFIHGTESTRHGNEAIR